MLPVFLQTSASPVDPISSATRWIWFGFLVFLSFGALGLKEGWVALLIASSGGAIIIGLYGPPLYRIGRLRKPLSVFSLEDVVEPVTHAAALARIERINSVLRVLVSWLLRFCGLLLISLALLLTNVFVLAGTVLIFFGVWIYAIGIRVGAKSAIQLLAHNEGIPHILYLRSFGIDHVGETETKRIRWWRPKAFLQAREEPVLSNLFSLHGPVIAVGEPGEPIPQLGAARMYLNDDDWKTQVKSLIDDASIVLLRVGNTGGFLWEVEQVLRAKEPEQILFYLSPSLSVAETQAAYAAFRARTEHLFQMPLPQSIGIHNFLSFKSDWSAYAFGEMPTLPPPRISFWLPRWFTTLRYHNKLQLILGKATRPFFAGLSYEIGEKSVFSRLTIAIATFFGGPLTGGIMMAKSLLAVGESKWAVGIVFMTFSLILFILFANSLEGAPQNSDFGIELYLILNMLLALGFYSMWEKICGNSLQVHLRTGGRRVSGWVTVAIIIVGVTVWIIILENNLGQYMW